LNKLVCSLCTPQPFATWNAEIVQTDLSEDGKWHPIENVHVMHLANAFPSQILFFDKRIQANTSYFGSHSCCSLSHAQGYTTGQPIVGNSTNVLASSPMFVDATQFPGAPDVCAQINAAFTAAATAGISIVDGRGFPSSATCSPENANATFSHATGGSTLLLGEITLTLGTSGTTPAWTIPNNGTSEGHQPVSYHPTTLVAPQPTQPPVPIGLCDWGRSELNSPTYMAMNESFGNGLEEVAHVISRNLGAVFVSQTL
jgi:hypothetical protein